jgi:hypothetical protein
MCPDTLRAGGGDGSELGDDLTALELRADSGQQLFPGGELTNLALHFVTIPVLEDVKGGGGFVDVDRHLIGW